MRYLLAILLPPAAVSLSRSPKQLPVNVLLTACLWLPGVFHAVRVVYDDATRARTDRVADAVLAYEEQLRLARRAFPAARFIRSRA